MMCSHWARFQARASLVGEMPFFSAIASSFETSSRFLGKFSSEKRSRSRR